MLLAITYVARWMRYRRRLPLLMALLASSSYAFVSQHGCTSSLHEPRTTSNTYRLAHTTTSTANSEQLNTYPPIPPDLTHCFSSREWEQRCQLAVAYRIAYIHDWDECIFNHITLKVDGSDDAPDGPHFLLNDFGIGFDEITACNLLKVNLDGGIVDSLQPLPLERRDINSGKGRVFKPGYVLHSAIHAARHDVHAVWHGHDLDASAVSQTKVGILPLSQEATYALNKGLSYHPFEGSANDLSEQPRLVANLGPTNQILMLEDHGPIVACPRIEEAFAGMYFLTRACKYQIKSLSAAGGDLTKIHMPNDSTVDEMVRRMVKFDEAPSTAKDKPTTQQSDDGKEEDVSEMHDTPGLMFAYARRTAERKFGKDTIYR
eukprot:scaffold2931_cov204-Alexandrium_tamarense.AAC.17